MPTDELNAFYDKLETNPLPSSAIALWHALAYIRDKYGLSEWFAVASSSLCIRSGLQERNFYKMRNQLQQKGFIDFKSKGGNHPAIYRLLSANSSDSSSVNSSYTANSSDSSSVNSSCSSSDSSSVNSSALKDRQIDKQTDGQTRANWKDIEQSWTEVFKFRMKPNHIEILGSYLDENMSESLIVEALERVRNADTQSLNYLWKVLSNWDKQNIKSINDLVEHEKSRHNANPVRRDKSDNIAAIEEYFQKRQEG